MSDTSDEEEFLEITGPCHKGIVAGLPVIVVIDEADDTTWVAPANWFSKLILIPYMASWFYNDDSPIFIYKGSYFNGLIDWIFTPIPEDLDD